MPDDHRQRGHQHRPQPRTRAGGVRADSIAEPPSPRFSLANVTIKMLFAVDTPIAHDRAHQRRHADRRVGRRTSAHDDAGQRPPAGP